ncbi:hypothetical protein FA15DRAFT_97225 [Coprinopsis marcescibilis]|uniref:CCHC-type domain-containing protein n=1 Tax=Coprinopsis marcescibilis TaxID=230819 RepID=A0A5C3KL77_COPMA|nr:hypothetical protein FA15DRAFT_97225 [Coprinopsis marcescibilis]
MSPHQRNTSTSKSSRPKRCKGMAATSTGYLVPDSISRVFSSGWSTHVSLVHLTDKYCQYKNASSLPQIEEGFLLDSTTGKISTFTKQGTNSEEFNLTFDEWHQAWGRLLPLIQRHLLDEYDLWKTHYGRILEDQTRSEHWPLWLAYDIEVRKRCVATNIDPSVFHANIWNTEQTRYFKNAAIEAGRAAGSSTNNYRSQSSNFPTRSTSQRRDPKEQPFRSTHTGMRKEKDDRRGRCIFCGDSLKSHASRHCQSSTNITGRSCHITKQSPNDRPRVDANGNAYCYGYNGQSGCAKGSNCTHGEHWCSLCGSKSHGAQDCTTI